MQISIAPRGSPDYAAGRLLARSRHHPFFSVEAEPESDCFVVARARGRGEGPLAACAGLTFARRIPLLSERRLGRPIEAVIGARERRAVERCMIVEIDAVASNDAIAENELVRALPLLVWCLGRQFVFCRATPRLRQTIDRLGTRFVMLRAARRSGESPERAARHASDGRLPVLGYTRTTSFTSNGDSGGHYCFDDVVVPFPSDAQHRAHRDSSSACADADGADRPNDGPRRFL